MTVAIYREENSVRLYYNLSGTKCFLDFFSPNHFLQGELPQEVTLCSSDTSHIWIPILLVYKAVELVFSLIFAFETRKVKVKELNDSKIIVFSVYTIVVSAIALIPMILLLQDKPTILYAVIGIVCLFTATVLLAIIYVPKVIHTQYTQMLLHCAEFASSIILTQV